MHSYRTEAIEMGRFTFCRTCFCLITKLAVHNIYAFTGIWYLHFSANLDVNMPVLIALLPLSVDRAQRKPSTASQEARYIGLLWIIISYFSIVGCRSPKFRRLFNHKDFSSKIWLKVGDVLVSNPSKGNWSTTLFEVIMIGNNLVLKKW